MLVTQRAFCIEGAPQLLCSSIPWGVSAWRGPLGRGPHVPVLGPSSPQAVAMLHMWGLLLLKVWAKSAEGVLYVCVSQRVCLLLTSVGAPEGPQGALRSDFQQHRPRPFRRRPYGQLRTFFTGFQIYPHV